MVLCRLGIGIGNSILVDMWRGKKASSRSKYVCLFFSSVYRIVSTLFFPDLKRSILLAYNYVHRTRGPPFIFTAFLLISFDAKTWYWPPKLALEILDGRSHLHDMEP
jgi:hypothetical protein